jgi:DNA polymerase III sliding clamp (beta) subunit (PCNA family)
MVAGSDTIYARQGDEVRWAQARQGAPDIKVLVKSLLKHPRWVIKREDLLVTVQTANLIGSRNAVMLLEIDGEHVKISCYDLEGGGAYERVVDVVRGGATEVAVVRINPQYLLKALGSSEGEEIKLGVRGPLDTVVVEDYEDYQAFISPMRD